MVRHSYTLRDLLERLFWCIVGLTAFGLLLYETFVGHNLFQQIFAATVAIISDRRF